MDDMKISSPQKPAVNKFERAECKGVSVSAEALIHTECLQPGNTLPLLVQPALDGIDLIAWATNNREFIETHLLKHGGLLFRNFDVKSASEFEQYIRVISGD